jgi:hypothetical protein
VQLTYDDSETLSLHAGWRGEVPHPAGGMISVTALEKVVFR